EPAAIGAEGHGTDIAGVSTQGFQFPAGLQVPDLDVILFSPRHQAAAIWAECHVQKRPGYPRLALEFRRLHLPKSGRVPRPHLDLALAARRSQAQAVAAEHHSADLAGVGAERANRLAVFRVPDLHLAVLVARD